MFSFERNLDFSGSDQSRFEPLATVISALDAKTELTTDDFMIVGAEARNLLHLSFGLEPQRLSTTRDIDVALAMPSWSGLDALSSAFELMDRSKSSIRFRVDNTPVDVIPFGGLEDPKGVVNPPTGSQLINVLGYVAAFEAAEIFKLPGTDRLKVVSPAFYVILKLEALADRSKWHKTKDAEDIGTALTWLEVDPSIEDHIYSNEFDRLVSHDFDLEVTLSEMFGRHLASLLDEQERTQLLEKVHELELDKFLGDLHRGLFRGNPVDKRAEAAQRFAALTKGLTSTRDT